MTDFLEIVQWALILALVLNQLPRQEDPREVDVQLSNALRRLNWLWKHRHTHEETGER